MTEPSLSTFRRLSARTSGEDVEAEAGKENEPSKSPYTFPGIKVPSDVEQKVVLQNQDHAPGSQQFGQAKSRLRGFSSRGGKQAGGDNISGQSNSAPLLSSQKSHGMSQAIFDRSQSRSSGKLKKSRIEQNEQFATAMPKKAQSLSSSETFSTSGNLTKKALSTTSLPSIPALDVLTDAEVSELTRVNTKKNSVRPLKLRFARVRQTIEALATANPYLLDALPLVNPDIEDYKDTGIDQLFQERCGPHVGTQEADLDYSPELAEGTTGGSLDFEPASENSVDQVGSKWSRTYCKPLSVRISTTVTIVHRLNATDTVRKQERENHPDRASAKVLQPRGSSSPEDFRLAGAASIGDETPGQARRRKFVEGTAILESDSRLKSAKMEQEGPPLGGPPSSARSI